jgi:hypothetical protein
MRTQSRAHLQDSGPNSSYFKVLLTRLSNFELKCFPEIGQSPIYNRFALPSSRPHAYSRAECFNKLLSCFIFSNKGISDMACSRCKSVGCINIHMVKMKITALVSAKILDIHGSFRLADSTSLPAIEQRALNSSTGGGGAAKKSECKRKL